MILDYLIIPQPKRQSFFNTASIYLWSSESNAFSMFIIARDPSILLQSHISTISDMNLLSPPINLFLIYAVYCAEIKL